MTHAIVDIKLGEYSLQLMPSLAALEQLSNGSGLEDIAKKVSNLEFDAIKKVIIVGLGLSGNGAKELPQLIYQTGLTNLAPLCITYINLLANGGRLTPSEEEAMARNGD